MIIYIAMHLCFKIFTFFPLFYHFLFCFTYASFDGEGSYAIQREEMVILIRNTERDLRGIVYTPWPSKLTEPVG